MITVVNRQIGSDVFIAAKYPPNAHRFCQIYYSEDSLLWTRALQWRRDCAHCCQACALTGTSMHSGIHSIHQKRQTKL
ncbi:hypothetical protein NC652_031049 [Populus alba x Populus x berolinensis]|nr:hypothetical protein NC652_031049 [Populus alba x Populus x berolinensis]